MKTMSKKIFATKHIINDTANLRRIAPLKEATNKSERAARKQNTRPQGEIEMLRCAELMAQPGNFCLETGVLDSTKNGMLRPNTAAAFVQRISRAFKLDYAGRCHQSYL